MQWRTGDGWMGGTPVLHEPAQESMTGISHRYGIAVVGDERQDFSWCFSSFLYVYGLRAKRRVSRGPSSSYPNQWLLGAPAASTASWQLCAAVSNSSNLRSLWRPRSRGSESKLE